MYIIPTGNREIVTFEGKHMAREEYMSCMNCGVYWRYCGEQECPCCRHEVEPCKPLHRVVPAQKRVNPMVRLHLLIQDKKLQLAEYQHKLDMVFDHFSMEEAARVASHYRKKIKIISNIISVLERKLK